MIEQVRDALEVMLRRNDDRFPEDNAARLAPLVGKALDKGCDALDLTNKQREWFRSAFLAVLTEERDA